MNSKKNRNLDKLKSNGEFSSVNKMKKIIFIICISAVFFYGLFLFKADVPGLNSQVTMKNPDIKEIVADGFNNLKSWGYNTINSFSPKGNETTDSRFDSSAYDIKKNAGADSYKSSSLKKFMNDISVYLFNKTEEFVRNLY